MGRVVADTDIVKSSCFANNAREIVDLPAPDGDDKTSIRPRRGISNGCETSLFNVLHLLSKLLYGCFHIQT